VGSCCPDCFPHALSGVSRIECPPEVAYPKQGAQGVEAPADCLRPAAQPRGQKTKDQACQAEVGEVQMCDCHSPAVERCPKETREKLVPYTETRKVRNPATFMCAWAGRYTTQAG
jgi:hypothetical protein